MFRYISHIVCIITYFKVDIGDTIDIEAEKEDIENNKKSAVCHAFNIDIDEFEANYKLDDFEFSYCDLYN